MPQDEAETFDDPLAGEMTIVETEAEAGE